MRYIKIIENKPYYYSVDMRYTSHRYSNNCVIYKSDPWRGRLYGKSELFNILFQRKNCHLYFNIYSNTEVFMDSKCFNMLRGAIL